MKAFVQRDAKFIKNPEFEENYIRAYGRGNSAKDFRDFEKDGVKTPRSIKTITLFRVTTNDG